MIRTITTSTSRRVSTLDAEEKENRRNFYHGFTVAVILAIVLFGLVLGWLLKYGGGVASFGEPQNLLAIHILFMVLFLLILHAFSSLVYRFLPNQKKGTTKLIHAGFHFLVCIGASIGFAAAIDLHNQESSPKHFYSVHSWLGLASLCIYYLQFLGGFFVFLLKLPGPNFRMGTLPVHKLIGQLVLYFVCGAVLTGLYSEATSSSKSTTGIPISGLELNIGALLTICFTFNIIYLLTAYHFRRPIFEEVEPLLANPQMKDYYSPSSVYAPGPSK